MSQETIEIAAICGSLQERSSNGVLLQAAIASVPAGVSVTEFRSLGAVPACNPEIDGDGPEAPAAVWEWRSLLRCSDGLLIVSPEYGHSMPGVLKNALDWVVGSGELSGMPIGLITASPMATGGLRAQIALIQTLLAQAAYIDATLAIPGVKSKVRDGELVHKPTARRLGETMAALAESVRERPERLIPGAESGEQVHRRRGTSGR
jgi:chromate reductase